MGHYANETFTLRDIRRNDAIRLAMSYAKCDAIVEQLTAAQEVIELDREIVNE
jgi:hypothetical protein